MQCNFQSRVQQQLVNSLSRGADKRIRSEIDRYRLEAVDVERFLLLVINCMDVTSRQRALFLAVWRLCPQAKGIIKVISVLCYYLTAASNRRLVQTSGCKVHKTR